MIATLILFLAGGGLAAVAVVLLCVVAFLLMRKSAGGGQTSSDSGSVDDGIKRHWLLLIENSVQKGAWHIGDRTATIGRAPTNFVQLDYGDVTRVHAQVRMTSAGFQLLDMTSSNGTLLNDKPVKQVVLKDRDVLTLGTRSLVYRAEGDFGVNTGFDRKAAGKRQVNEGTQIAGVREMDQAIEAHMALAETGNDFAAAAEKLGITEVELRALVGEG
ncbi:MAG: FHA domain-containing protein [Myxococcota bacterium]|nr:FHA domain-containing protein [Myxococcota bacterium]